MLEGTRLEDGDVELLEGGLDCAGWERTDGMPGGAGSIVLRERLVSKVLELCKSDGVVTMCAPKGFGKTAVMIQCASRVRNDPERGVAALVGASHMGVEGLIDRLDRCGRDISPEGFPVILIDDIPFAESSEMAVLAQRLRSLRAAGFNIIASCTPENGAYLSAMRDSGKIGAHTLRVQPYEYGDWAHAFSISSSLDVYEMTQGVPSLVMALHAVSPSSGASYLDSRVEELYRAILGDTLRTDRKTARLLALIILMGEGSISDLGQSGTGGQRELVGRLGHDYPVFRVNETDGTFSCLGETEAALSRLRLDIAQNRPELVKRAVRMHMKARRVDRAVGLLRSFVAPEEALDVIGRFPVHFALSGHGRFVQETLAQIGADHIASVEIGVILGLYLASLTTGDYQVARSTARELGRRAMEAKRDVSERDWACALAVRRVWSTCPGAALPDLGGAHASPERCDQARSIGYHARTYGELVGGSGNVDLRELPFMRADSPRASKVSVLDVLLQTDRAIDDALHHAEVDAMAHDAELSAAAETLGERGLRPLAVRARMAVALCRLMSGRPIVDERAFNDAGTAAVREADQATQLLCLLAEGWQALSLGQAVNGQFRGQQVLRLAEEGHAFLRGWALPLEQTAVLMNSSRSATREDADVIDLAQEVDDPAYAWAVALRLSAARYDADLSVWYSLHKALLLEERMRPMVRLAMELLGERAESIRRLIPSSLSASYRLDEGDARASENLRGIALGTCLPEVGQININLFGGFKIDRNGHVLTDDIWKRKKTGILAARLVLNLGAYVSRSTIIDEMWPDTCRERGRQSLYTATSALKNAFRQTDDGPQYLLNQGDGVALNNEFVSSDTARFDLLAREILLKRMGTSSRTIVEACLKLEELYTGPLFAPDVGNASFFLRMRRAYESKFVDCLIRGIDAALDDEDVSSAAWLADAAQAQDPSREDVLRRAMKIFNMCGRRREIIDMYGAHLYYLQHEMDSEPEPETKRIYEQIINGPVRFL